MRTQNKTQITAYVRCISPGNRVEQDKVYPTSGLVLSPEAVICYYLVDLETPVPAAQFTIDAVVSQESAKRTLVNQKVNLNTLKKGTRYKQFDTDDYNYVIVGNYPTYIKYRIDIEGARVMTHPKAFPAIMVTIVNK
jgi:hypothetical protein